MRYRSYIAIVTALVLLAGCDDGGTDGHGGAVCGNGVREATEQCDGSDLGTLSCQALGYVDGQLRCTDSCRIDTSGCHTCGNGIVEEGEECDGTDLGGHTCQDLRNGSGSFYTGGELSCTNGCTFDTSGCFTCPNGVREAGEECDGSVPASVRCSDFSDANGEPYQEGELSCTSECTIDTSGCHTCGNGLREGPEQCDGTDFGTYTCSHFTDPFGNRYSDGHLTCTQSCTIDTSQCSFCGNGLREGTEGCDGSDLGGLTCNDFTDPLGNPYTSGLLSCTDGCAIDTSGCSLCGNGIREGAEECDGADSPLVTCRQYGFWTGGGLTCTSGCTYHTGACLAPSGLVTGTAYSCAWAGTTLACWGTMDPDHGPDSSPPYVPRRLGDFPNASGRLWAGPTYLLAETYPQGAVLTCWGRSAEGQCGTTDGYVDVPGRAVPTDLHLGGETFHITAWHEVSPGPTMVCAVVTVEGSYPLGEKVVCWGSGPEEMWGNYLPATSGSCTQSVTQDGTMVTCTSPTLIGMQNHDTGYTAVDVAVGSSHVCAVLSTGSTLCWGDNSMAQLGITPDADGGPHYNEVWDDTGRPLRLRDITAERNTTCGHTESGAGGGIVCWGENPEDILGAGLPYLSAPRTLDAADAMDASGFTPGDVVMAFGEESTVMCLVRSDDGKHFCWGSNTQAQLGWGFPIPGFVPWEDIVLGDTPLPYVEVAPSPMGYACGTTERTVVCWGRNTGLGSLGADVTGTYSGTPVEVEEPD